MVFNHTNKIPVKSTAEEEFKDKYSKETLALIGFIKSRKQISSSGRRSVRGFKRNQSIDAQK